jgi:hypothetical protein
MGPITLLILNMIINIIYYILCGIIIFKLLTKTLLNSNMLFLLPIIYYICFLILSFIKDVGIGYGSIALTIQRIHCSGKMNKQFMLSNSLKFAIKNITPLTIILLPKFMTDSGLLFAHKSKGLYTLSKVLNVEIGPLNLMELLIWGPFKSLFANGNEVLSKGSIPKYFNKLQKNLFSGDSGGTLNGGKRKFTFRKIFKFMGIVDLYGGDDDENNIGDEIYGDGEENIGLINGDDKIEPDVFGEKLFPQNTYIYASLVTFCLAFFLTFINAINYFELLLYTERYGCSMSPTEKIRLHNKIRKSMSECNPNNVKASKDVSL